MSIGSSFWFTHLCTFCHCLPESADRHSFYDKEYGHRRVCKNCMMSDEYIKLVEERRMRKKETDRKKGKRYRSSEKGKRVQKIATVKKSARRRSLPSDYTTTDWQNALQYFNGCCAVCGRQLYDLFGTVKAAQDHWIPLAYTGADNPGTVATNIVPLCHGTGDSCNMSKRDHMPEAWLKEQFGARKASQILKDILTYFEWVKELRDGNKNNNGSFDSE